MTINGPAPMLLGFFLNSAIDQQCELYIKEHGLEARSRRRSSASSMIRACRPSYQGTDAAAATTGSACMLLGLR
jgi:methylmalonyl-CoA mutase